MILLYDFITVCRQTGAGEYVRRVFYEILNSRAYTEGHVEVIGLYDAERGIAYDDLSLESLQKLGVLTVDIHGRNLAQLCRELHAGHLFVGCAQYWWMYEGLEEVDCAVTCVVHDLSYQEKWQNHIDEYMKLGKRSLLALCYSLARLRLKKDARHVMAPVVALAQRNPKVKIVAVSDYTRWSIAHLYPQLIPFTMVCYSPLRRLTGVTEAENAQLRELIESGEPYLLLLGGDNPLKNMAKAVRAFARYARDGGHMRLVVTGGGRPLCHQQVSMPFLSESDLEVAMRHCRALLYPSCFEGFGYPPVEALRLGKPVICSNVCSMPEVMGTAPIYFSPFYETDIYRALMAFDATDYNQLLQRACQRYDELEPRMEADLMQLLTRLTTPSE